MRSIVGLRSAGVRAGWRGGVSPPHESIVIAGFLLVAFVGFKHNLWFVVAALAAHGVFDFVHASVIADPGVPAWWPAFCLAYDGVTAAYLAVLLLRSRLPATAR